jgi:hypothetical protein
MPREVSLLQIAVPAALATGFIMIAGGSASPGSTSTSAAPWWMTKPFQLVVMTEGGGRYDAINPNTDGAGLSWGAIQWAQAVGGLYAILLAMHKRDAARFERTFGGATAAAALLAATKRMSLEPVAGAVLWQEPWLSRFRAAGKDPVWQQVQLQEAMHGVYMRAALGAVRTLGCPTERAVAVALDRAVQQGPSFVASHATSTMKRWASAEPGERLWMFGTTAASRYRRTTEPTEPYPSSRLAWKQVGEEWHVFAGSVDLYANIRARALKLLQSTSLSDVWIEDSRIAPNTPAVT